MKKITFLLISWFLSLGITLAGPTKEALDQLSHDLCLYQSEQMNNTPPTKEMLDEAGKEMDAFVKQCPEAVTFTPEDLQTLSKGSQITSDRDIAAAYKDLKDWAHGRPLPKLIEFYHAAFEKGALSPLQKEIYFRITKANTAQNKRAI